MARRLVYLALLLAACSQSTAANKPDAAMDAMPPGDGRADSASPDASSPDGAEPDAAVPDPAVLAREEANRRLFDPFAPLPRIDITLSPSDEQALRDAPDDYVRAEFTLTDKQGKVGPMQVEVRRKGRLGSAVSFDGKMAFKVDFDAAVKKQRLFGLGKLNLNNMLQDPSAVHEWVAYQLFESQGVPSPRAGYARVFVNGTQFGVYLSLEATDDKDFLARNFPSTRVLYEGEYGLDLFEGSEDSYDQDHGKDPDNATLKALTRAVATASSADAYRVLAPYVHWDEVLANLATEIFIGHWDGYGPTRNNYFLHFDDQGLVSLLPWGTDQTFKSELPFFDGQGLLLERCREQASCHEKLLKALGSVADASDAFEKNRGADLAMLADKLAKELETDPRARPGDVRALTAELRAFLKKRVTEARTLIACLADPKADTDGDGYKCRDDCREGDPKTHPSAQEICGDGVDQDCNGRIDDGACPACAADQSLGTKYLFCRDQTSYASAGMECTKQGGKLVKLASAEVNAALSSLAPRYLGDAWWWIGLDDRATEGTFVWSDGSTAGKAHSPSNVYECGAYPSSTGYCGWGPGEPNDFDNAEDCIESHSTGEWNDRDCGAWNAFICQVP